MTLRTDVTDDHIVDTLAGNRIYNRAVVVVNKIDLATEEDLKEQGRCYQKDGPSLKSQQRREMELKI